MRAIDADALKEDLTRFYDNEVTARNLIDEQPTIQPEPHWTPVKEQLPKEDGSYLVSGKWGSGKESVGDCEFSMEDGYFQTAWNFDVLAWMPLPPSYKEEEE